MNATLYRSMLAALPASVAAECSDEDAEDMVAEFVASTEVRPAWGSDD